MDLRFNQLKQLPETLGNLSSLKILDLSYNRIKRIPYSIGNLNNLRNLNLKANKILFLPESIGNLSEDWITWVCTVPRASDKVYAYHIPDGNQITMSPSNTDQGIGSLEINDGWIAWDIGTKIHENGGHDILQWRVFP